MVFIDIAARRVIICIVPPIEARGSVNSSHKPARLETELPGVERIAQGKVRDVYDLGEHLLSVATDRISAFDYILATGIPDKGRVLTQLSVFWFDYLREITPTHFVTARV